MPAANSHHLAASRFSVVTSRLNHQCNQIHSQTISERHSKTLIHLTYAFLPWLHPFPHFCQSTSQFDLYCYLLHLRLLTCGFQVTLSCVLIMPPAAHYQTCRDSQPAVSQFPQCPSTIRLACILLFPQICSGLPLYHLFYILISFFRNLCSS
jgi:hypothetical protein